MIQLHTTTTENKPRKRAQLKVVALFALVAGLVFAPGASAFMLGIDPEFRLTTAANASLATSAFTRINAGFSRQQVGWNSVAPTKPANPADPNDPAYRWRDVDAFVRTVSAAGAQPLLSFETAPTWAEGPGRPSSAPAGAWRPSATQFGLFARAVAKRYNGLTEDPLGPAGRNLPRVRLFQSWNEPNYQVYLSPMGRSGERFEAVEQFRALNNQFYDGVKSVQPSATVVLGGLGPYATGKLDNDIHPQAFAAQLLCLKGTWRLAIKDSICPAPAKFDALDFHPYAWEGTPTSRAESPLGGTLGNAPDFRKLLDLAIAYKTVYPAGPKQLWATETGWLTNAPGRKVAVTDPANPGRGFRVYGYTPQKAALYTAEMIYRLWAARVDFVEWYSLVDWIDPDATFRANKNWAGGLYFTPRTTYWCPGTKPCAKPSVEALRFPVFGSPTTLWAMTPCRAPGSAVTFEAWLAKSSAWTPVATVNPSSDGVATTAWTAPDDATSVRANVSGGGCTDSSMTVPMSAS